MDTTYFDKKNIRDKAKSVNEKSYLVFIMIMILPLHGLWGAIRESSLIKCNSQRINIIVFLMLRITKKLKSVWKDCYDTMNKILDILVDIYGYPNHLIMESI